MTIVETKDPCNTQMTMIRGITWMFFPLVVVLAKSRLVGMTDERTFNYQQLSVLLLAPIMGSHKVLPLSVVP